jgi:hypothetical protein
VVKNLVKDGTTICATIVSAPLCKALWQGGEQQHDKAIVHVHVRLHTLTF